MDPPVFSSVHLHPNSTKRWEDAASLEHECWKCKTKSNSPKALQTCYGIHSITCSSYHQTMHAIGAAHNCSGCATTRQMHGVRHKEISQIVAEYKALDESHAKTPSRKQPLRERSLNVVISDNRLNEQLHIQVENQQAADENDGDPIIIHQDDDAESVSSITHSLTNPNENSTLLKKQTKAEIRAEKKAIKLNRSAQKALKNQSKITVVVTSEDLAHVDRILHGNEQAKQSTAHPLATDKTIEDVMIRNLGFVKTIQAHKTALYRSVAEGRKASKHKQHIQKKEDDGWLVTEQTIELDGVVSAAMIRFGIDPSVVQASAPAHEAGARKSANNSWVSGRKRTATLTSPAGSSFSPAVGSGVTGKSHVDVAKRLRAAIKKDIEIHENEARARYERAAGFWRYASSKVFDRMMELSREIDLETGELRRSKSKDVGMNGNAGRDLDQNQNHARVDDGGNDENHGLYRDEHDEIDEDDEMAE